MRAANPTVQVGSIDGTHLILQARPVESWLTLGPLLEQAFRYNGPNYREARDVLRQMFQDPTGRLKQMDDQREPAQGALARTANERFG